MARATGLSFLSRLNEASIQSLLAPIPFADRNDLRASKMLQHGAAGCWTQRAIRDTPAGLAVPPEFCPSIMNAQSGEMLELGLNAFVIVLV